QLAFAVRGQLPAERPRRELGRALSHGGGGDPRALGAEALALAEPHGEPALSARMRERERLEGAARLAGGQQPAQLGRRLRAELLALEHAERDRVRPGGACVFGGG